MNNISCISNYFWIWHILISQMRRQGSGGIVGIHLHIYSFKSPYVTANGLLHFVLLNVCDINLFLVNNKIFAPFWKTLLSAARLFDRFWQLAVSSSWNKLSAVSCLLVQLWTPPWCCAQYWHCRTWMDNMEIYLVLAEQIVVWPGASLPPLAGCWQCWRQEKYLIDVGFNFQHTWLIGLLLHDWFFEIFVSTLRWRLAIVTKLTEL